MDHDGDLLPCCYLLFEHLVHKRCDKLGVALEVITSIKIFPL